MSFTHAYRSNFSVGNYTTNLSGQWDENGNATETDIAGNYISQKQIMTLNILEQFAPLLGVDMTFSNNMSVKFEYKKSTMVQSRLYLISHCLYRHLSSRVTLEYTSSWCGVLFCKVKSTYA